MLPELLIVDDALPKNERALWERLVLKMTEQSTRIPDEEVNDTGLMLHARARVGDLPLIHALAFAIREGHDTEMHLDVGEYVVLYYPIDCQWGPLCVRRGSSFGYVDVKANRLVFLDCTTIAHQQIVPNDGSVRRTIALKFRRAA